MKKILPSLLLLTLIILSTLGCRPQETSNSADLLQEVKQRGYLIIGTKFDAPPFGYIDQDQVLKGFEIDLAHALAKAIIGKEDAVKFVQVNSSTRVTVLKAKQADFILATMTVTPDREKIVRFTKPYHYAKQGMLVKTTSPYKSVWELKQKRIAYIIGSTAEKTMRTKFPHAQLLGYKSHAEALSAFNAGRTDALGTDDSILMGLVHLYCGVKILPERLSVEPYAAAFRRDEASMPLFEVVQENLAAFESNGDMETLQKKWHHPEPPENCPENT